MLTEHGCFRKRLHEMRLCERKECDCGWCEENRDHIHCIRRKGWRCLTAWRVRKWAQFTLIAWLVSGKILTLLELSVTNGTRRESVNFDVKDEPRFGRLVTDKVDANLEKVEQDWHITSYDIAEELGIDYKTEHPRGSYLNWLRGGYPRAPQAGLSQTDGILCRPTRRRYPHRHVHADFRKARSGEDRLTGHPTPSRSA
ncbi:hypothetical protein EVAR_489_1 [Eumeta japonica]|uniref:Histone-lysine N-methyltransferase SETMAR n=1 Tax=Eumeta variegata TaxID=151549 RepID=A0A4C1SDB5_EUMVA|nr:hypothetical protein EVAR_489_1 [Eumeta japonica]